MDVHCTEPYEMPAKARHPETVVFHLFESAQHALILGYPWLKKNNLHIDWEIGKIIGWGRECFTTCSSESICSVKVKEPEPVLPPEKEMDRHPDLA